MPHALVPRLLPCSLLLLAALGCPAGPEGDDLPPGAFTSGDDVVVDPTDTDGMTSVASGDTTTAATTDDPTTAPPDTGSDDTPGVFSHDADIQPIWTANCTAAPCHDSDAPQAGLDLQSAGVRERLCMNNSASFPSINLVDCDGMDPGESWIYSKVTGDGLDVAGAGSLMPPGSMLTPDDIAAIEAWILGGALP